MISLSSCFFSSFVQYERKINPNLYLYLQIDLKGDFHTLRNTIKEMRHLKWTDRFTRAVFVEFTVYNAQVNLFVIVNMVAEFVDSAGIYVHYRVDPVNLLGQVGPVGNFELACQVRHFPWCSLSWSGLLLARMLHKSAWLLKVTGSQQNELILSSFMVL